MENIQNLYDFVEKFIHDIDSKNVIITDRAEDIRTFELGKGALGREAKKDVGSLRSYLGKVIAEYDANKYNPILRLNCARELNHVIRLLETNNVLDYPNLSAKAQKYDELEKDYEKLKSDHIKLTKLYNACLKEKGKFEQENKLLHGFDRKENKRFDGNSESGGLQSG